MSAPLVWIAAGALGAVGACVRFALDRAIALRTAGAMPWGTLVVNLSGALALGVVVGADVTGDARVLVAGGLLGSFTTFSTWMLETHRLAEEGRARLGLLNLGLGVALGLGALGVGWWIGALA